MRLHARTSTVPGIDSDRDDWWRSARCTGVDRDTWTSENYVIRMHAAHQCVAHCPVLDACRRDAAGKDWRTTAIAGVVYDHEGLVQADRGFPPCAACGPPSAEENRQPRPRRWLGLCAICGSEFVAQHPTARVCRAKTCRQEYERVKKSAQRAREISTG